jgi:hypothetical protein
MADPVCQICDFTLNKTTRREIACPYCQFSACKTCCETYVLNESVVKCMNTTCGREWTRQFIVSAFPAIFITGKLKKHQENVLFDTERALLPATQPIVERILKTEGLNTEYIKNREHIRKLQIKNREIQNDIYRLNRGQTPAAERAEFVKACSDEGCRGFLSTQWKCGICQKWTCPQCHVVKGLDRDVEHTCNPDTVATVALLAGDTKPCPNCRTGIFKINGCDQMFCTQCNTGFNWRTGRIETNIHNPHYFEWLRRQNANGEIPRTPGDLPCRNELTHRHYQEVRNILADRHPMNPYTKECGLLLERVIRNVIHMRYVIIPVFEQGARHQRNESLRIAYMRNHITEDAFKTILQRDHKKSQKKQEIHNVLDILFNTVTDIILRFITHLREAPANEFTPVILQEINPIVDYANECFFEISKTYKSKGLRFTSELRET